MGEVFKGWRRKSGCITLLMAFVLMCGWLRSRNYPDTIYVFYETVPVAITGTGTCVLFGDTVMVFPQQTPLVIQSCNGFLGGWYNTISANDDLSGNSDQQPDDESNGAPFDDNRPREHPTMPRTWDYIRAAPRTESMVGGPISQFIYWNVPPSRLGIDQALNTFPATQHWQWCGFAYGFNTLELKSGTGAEKLRMNGWVIPYWSVTIPLTLLSDYLLLYSKPKTLIMKKRTELIPEMVT